MSSVTVTVNLNDKFSGKLQKINNELIDLARTTKEVSKAIDKMIKSNSAAEESLKKMTERTVETFSTINRQSFSEAASKVSNLTNHMRGLIQETKHASATAEDSFKKMAEQATKSFSTINKNSLPETISKVGDLTKHMKGLTQEAKNTASVMDRLAKLVSRNSSVSGASGQPPIPIKDNAKNLLKNTGKNTLSAVSWIGNTAIDLTKKVISASKPAVQLSSDTEQANVAFEPLLKGTKDAKQFDRDLIEYTNNTPYELSQNRTAAMQLLTSGVDPDKVTKYMAAAGNAATGTGIGIRGFEDITSSINRMQMDGGVSEKEMSTLVSIGIPAWEILSRKMNKTTDQLKNMVRNGSLPAKKAMDDLIDSMNEMSPKAMEKQGQTLAGLFAVIKNTFNFKLLERWGDGISQALKPRLDQLVQWINSNGPTIARWGEMIQNVAFTAANRLATMFQGAFDYIQTRYFNKPDFMNLSPEAKIGFVIDDLYKSFNTWYENGGMNTIYAVTDKLATTLGDAIGFLAPKLFDIGIRLALPIIGGLAQGLWHFATEHPLLAIIGGLLLTKNLVGGAGILKGLSATVNGTGWLAKAARGAVGAKAGPGAGAAAGGTSTVGTATRAGTVGSRAGSILGRGFRGGGLGLVVASGVVTGLYTSNKLDEVDEISKRNQAAQDTALKMTPVLIGSIPWLLSTTIREMVNKDINQVPKSPQNDSPAAPGIEEIKTFEIFSNVFEKIRSTRMDNDAFLLEKAIPSYPPGGDLDQVPYGLPFIRSDAPINTGNGPVINEASSKNPIQFTLNYHGERMSETEIDNIMGIFARKLEGVAHG